MFCKIGVVKAYATNDELNISVKYITSEDATKYNNQQISNLNNYTVPIQTGDYAVSLSIKNNTGFTSIGYRIYYDPDVCTPVYKNSTDALGAPTKLPIFDKGVAGDDVILQCALNTDQHLLGIGSMAGDTATADGIICTFFFRPSDKLFLSDELDIVTNHEVCEWKNNGHNVNVHDNTGFTLFHYVSPTLNQNWIIGDIDQDGEITAVDAQLILSLYTDYTVTDGQIIYTSEYNGTYTLSTNPATTADGIYVVTVSDVNSDGVVDVTDASLVLQYYTDYEVGHGNLNNYNGLIGTETGVYIEYTVTFN